MQTRLTTGKVGQSKGRQVNRGYIFTDARSPRTRAEITLAPRGVVIEASTERRTYPHDTVRIDRYDGNTFELVLGEERLFFESDNPLRLTFDFIPALEAHRKRRQRDRPRNRRPRRRAVPTAQAAPPDQHGDGRSGPPPEEPWTGLAIGHESAELIEAVADAKRREPPAHEHRWEMSDDATSPARVCAECRQVLIDLSDSANDGVVTTDG